MIKYLLGRASTGKMRYAVVECDEEWHEPEHGYIIQRSYGQVQGKNTLSPAIIVDKTKQKRTWKEQYVLQFNSEVKKFLDKGYIEVEKHPNEYTLEELESIFGEVKTNQFGVPKPQLAKQSEKVTNPKIFDNLWLASRKIDGVRALVTYDGTECHIWSRGGENYDYSTNHLRKHPTLLKIFETYPTLILDCELYKFGKSLQTISGAARMEVNAVDCDWLELYCYDCLFTDNLDMTADERIRFLEDLSSDYNFGFDPYKEWKEGELQFQMVPHVEVKGWDNIKKLHDQYVLEGFEGVVIRDPDKPYKPGSRTNSMIKVKSYKDSEFLVTGYELGLRGSEDMVFICETAEGKEFKAMPLGDRATKEEYVENFETSYKGKLATCKFFYYSDDNVPLQPKLICFRDYE